MTRTALRDLDALEEGGVDGILVENFGDVPYAKTAPPETIAFMTVVVEEILRKSRAPVGVNVLRSDGPAAMSIAAATGAPFIRVNVYCGVAFTDQGTIEGDARQLLTLRHRLTCDVKILADVHVKHAAHPTTVEQATIDAARNRADALIVSGIGTGRRTSAEDLQAAKQVTSLPVFVGSGVRIDNLSTYRDADGFIVGCALKRDGAVEAAVDVARVRALANAVSDLRNGP